jgi:hypothetical protein
MATDSILSLIDDEIARLKQVRSLLATTGKATERLTKKAAKAVRGVKAVRVVKAAPATKAKKRRVLSPEARQRIADAQRKRWAAQKAQA